MTKTLQKVGIEGTYLNIMKTNSQLTSFSMVKYWKHFPEDQEIGRAHV